MRSTAKEGGLTLRRIIYPAILSLGLVVFAEVVSAGIAPQIAEAQTGPVQVESNVKGTIGLGMVGAELGFVIPAAVGLEDLWAYIVFPIVGAAGGAVGGYFAFDNNDIVEGSVAALAAGMALVIPALVLTLALTAYDPSEEGIDADEAAGARAPPEEEPEEIDAELPIDSLDPEEPAPAPEPEPPPAETVPPPDTETPAPDARNEGGFGLFRMSKRGLGLGIPMVSFVPTSTTEEVARYGGQNDTEYRVSLVSGAF
jgi:hypothetical protein